MSTGPRSSYLSEWHAAVDQRVAARKQRRPYAPTSMDFCPCGRKKHATADSCFRCEEKSPVFEHLDRMIAARVDTPAQRKLYEKFYNQRDSTRKN